MNKIQQWTQSQYRVYTIKSGNKNRQIEEPLAELKEKQREILKKYTDFPFDRHCHSVKGKSILTNASVHEGARHLLRVDIKSCYQSTTRNILVKGYELGVVDNNFYDMMNFHEDLDYCLWFDGKDWILPTGAPTSPVLCNVALTWFDRFLALKVENMGYRYSRYFDDIHISTTNIKRDWEVKELVEGLLDFVGYKPNKKKSKWLTVNSDKTIITGVSIGQGSNVPNSFYRMMRARLNNLARENKPIDQETRGCLAYINSIDADKYQYLLDYYQKRHDRYIK